MRWSKVLQRALADGLEGIHAQRRRAVFRAVEGLVDGGGLWLTGLGRALPGACVDKHRIKAADRLLGNAALWRELSAFYRVLFVWLCKHNKRPVVLVDWTGVGPQRCAITQTLAFSGRALPILSHVHPLHDLHARHAQRDFVAALAKVIPSNCTPILVTDAGFHSTWFTAVIKQGWDIVGRVRGKTGVRVGDSWTSVRHLLEQAGDSAQDLGNLWLYKGHPEQYRFVLAKKRTSKGRKRRTRRTRKQGQNRSDKTYASSAREPWLLATTLRCSSDSVIAIYSLRMQIEEAYRDLKSYRHGWSLHLVRSRTPRRIEVLLMIAAIANVAMHIIGLAAEGLQIQRQFQANTTRHRRVLSLFVLARLAVARGILLPECAYQDALGIIRRIATRALPP